MHKTYIQYTDRDECKSVPEYVVVDNQHFATTVVDGKVKMRKYQVSDTYIVHAPLDYQALYEIDGEHTLEEAVEIIELLGYMLGWRSKL